MLDDNKHDTRVPVNLTDREFHDANVQAMALDKKPAEFVRYVLRLFMYGTVSATTANSKENSSAD